jgi:hypothetical protein
MRVRWCVFCRRNVWSHALMMIGIWLHPDFSKMDEVTHVFMGVGLFPSWSQQFAWIYGMVLQHFDSLFLMAYCHSNAVLLIMIIIYYNHCCSYCYSYCYSHCYVDVHCQITISSIVIIIILVITFTTSNIMTISTDLFKDNWQEITFFTSKSPCGGVPVDIFPSTQSAGKIPLV